MLTQAMTKNSSQLVQLDGPDPGDGSKGNSIGMGKQLFGLDTVALAARMLEIGEPAWRGPQLAEALYRQRIAEISDITTLPKLLRQKLVAEGWVVGRPRITQVFRSVDGTERYLVQGQGQGLDAQTVETVWMPEGDEGESGDGSEPDLPETLGAPSFPLSSAERMGSQKFQPEPTPPRKKRSEGYRATICVSSQAGCAVNCQFCLTAKLGLQRNLTRGEIAGQVIAVLDRHGVEVGRDRVNLVFMGMGEPFLNYGNFMGAVRLLFEEVGLSPQRMTVSTSGIVPGIERFALEPAEVRPKLAISLNAPNDRVREELMPINRKWPIQAVIDATRGVKLRSRERITFEYVLLAGVTDQPEHAVEVAKLVQRSGLPAKVNLIAWNPGPGIVYTMPKPEAVEAFRNALADQGIPAYLRKPRGRDIFAACGQLKRTVEG
jgi:23S rRNA (adenine2503-C2)-methyltransferase